MMGTIEKETLFRTIQNMSKEEKEIVVKAIPIELCFNRIGQELSMQRGCINQIASILLTAAPPTFEVTGDTNPVYEALNKIMNNTIALDKKEESTGGAE